MAVKLVGWSKYHAIAMKLLKYSGIADIVHEYADRIMSFSEHSGRLVQSGVDVRQLNACCFFDCRAKRTDIVLNDHDMISCMLHSRMLRIVPFSFQILRLSCCWSLVF